MRDAFDDIAGDRVQTRAPGSSLRLVELGGVAFRSDPQDTLGISMAVAGRHAISFATGGRRVELRPRLGQFGLMAPGYPADIKVSGECLVLQLSLPTALVRSWWAEDSDVAADPAQLFTMHSLVDHGVARALFRAWRFGAAPDEETLRMISLSVLSLVHPRSSTAKRLRGGLTARQLARVFDFMDDHISTRVRLSDLAQVAGLSPFHFARELRVATGRSAGEHIVQRRLLRAMSHLRDRHIPLQAVAAASGFAHVSHLSRHLVRHLGHTPSQVRRALVGGSAAAASQARSGPDEARRLR